MSRVLLDTNVFIFSIKHPRSNSNIIVDMALDGDVEVVISEEIRLELIEYLRSEHGRDAAYHAEGFLRGIPDLEIVGPEEMKGHIKKLKGRIKDKDLPHLAAAEVSRVEAIVSYDRDFKKAKTKIPVFSPREFVKELGIEPFEIEY
jgi:predicted nucleic acid-binding protein